MCQDCPCSLSLPCHLTATLLCLGLTAVSHPVLLSGSTLLHGKALDNHVTQALPALGTGHICRADAQPQGCREQGSPSFPRAFAFLHHPLLLGHPSASSLFTVCLRKAPDSTSPFHMLNSKASQRDPNFLALPIACRHHDPALPGI